MVFSSLLFAFYFLPIVLTVYYISKEQYRNYILLIASLVFYSYGEPHFVFVMLFSIFINYVLAIIIDQTRGTRISVVCMIADVSVNIGILFAFKYLNFFTDILNSAFRVSIPSCTISLPIGISFFTFQALSYVIDVYRGDVEVQKNPLLVALYISFFPQLVAGPIVRYSSIEKQIINRTWSSDLFSEGALRFMLGFSKKVILANNLALVAKDTFSCDVTTSNPLYLWIGSICYSMQIYFDFSGYSDMAIGLGKLFGFTFEENFDYPYIAGSITDFWRRWHISLGRWFRDYVYIPLGGSRVSIRKHIFNLFVVWILTGIWHGANYTFIAWGLGYFVLITLEKTIVHPEKRSMPAFKILWQLFTLICVNFGWVIFNSDSLRNGLRYCLAMIGYYGVKFTVDTNTILTLNEYGFFIAFGLIASTPFVKMIKKKLDSSFAANTLAFAEPLAYGLMFLWATSFLILGAHNPFIYFNF